MKTILTLALGAIAVVPAAAGSIAVPYADLNLTRPAAVAELDRRLVRAARRVCEPQGRDLHAARQAALCRSEALASARSRAADATATMAANAAARTKGG